MFVGYLKMMQNIKNKEENKYSDGVYCYDECPECLGSGAIFNGDDYIKCKQCEGNGMIINDKNEGDD